ncbi:hypothetical protein STAS_11745, partial [Striga asiatica]
AHSFVSRIKTLAGHNLDPTPWHVFPSTSPDPQSTLSRASTILRCTYLVCTDNNNNNKPTLPDLVGPTKTERPTKCPSFFDNIRADLGPWEATGISSGHVAEARKHAAFRVVIVGGVLYVDFYYACVQSRAMFTIWGILQLLRRYPGQVPDVDLMFDCMDKPVVNQTVHADVPLPLFRYCTTSQHFDIPFPDWSFWGWSEINIGPWEEEFKKIKEGSRRRRWVSKRPFAYWKGNPDVLSPVRTQLLECNDTQKWNAQIMRQDWGAAARGGFQDSKLAKQCAHRYKIYAEGYAWSVSLKYILSCGSCTLIIAPQYQDFFSRGLAPHVHYLPIPSEDICPAIKFAVDWGNSYPSEAESIGRAGQEFMAGLSMNRVYDYMYHLLVKYSSLQRFEPARPSSAVRVCEESVLCFADEKQKEWLQRSVASRALDPPCSMDVN